MSLSEVEDTSLRLLSAEFADIKRKMKLLEQQKERIRKIFIEKFKSGLDVSAYNINISKSERVDIKATAKEWEKKGFDFSKAMRKVPEHLELNEAKFKSMIDSHKDAIICKTIYTVTAVTDDRK